MNQRWSWCQYWKILVAFLPLFPIIMNTFTNIRMYVSFQPQPDWEENGTRKYNQRKLESYFDLSLLCLLKKYNMRETSRRVTAEPPMVAHRIMVTRIPNISRGKQKQLLDYNENCSVFTFGCRGKQGGLCIKMVNTIKKRPRDVISHLDSTIIVTLYHINFRWYSTI